jgi:cytochrome c peroxidase
MSMRLPKAVKPGDATLAMAWRAVPAIVLLCALAFGAGLLLAVGSRAAAPANEPISPIPAASGSDPGKLALGKQLFSDVRLSHDNKTACASCHQLDKAGDDGRARSIGSDGRLLEFNTTTIFNAALSFRLNWRGDFVSLENQNEAVLLSETLMNTNWEELLPELEADPRYQEGFTAIYGAGPERRSVLDALATFQRSLTTPDARFDRYLRGERDAITAEEEAGYQLFKVIGCVACHQGVNIGGNLFQRFGIFADPFAGQAALTNADLGRFAVTGVESDKHVFRVPSLRNVAATAPYFHDGRADSLREAVMIMARVQLGRELGDGDADRIVKFLETLTGEHRGQPLVSRPASAQ